MMSECTCRRANDVGVMSHYSQRRYEHGQIHFRFQTIPTNDHNRMSGAPYTQVTGAKTLFKQLQGRNTQLQHELDTLRALNLDYE